MKKGINLDLISKLLLTCILGVIVAYMIISMGTYMDNSEKSQVINIQNAIDKALVQCYALEGSYPSDLKHLESYEVLFDDDKYYYQYDIIGSNIKPGITVVSKDVGKDKSGGLFSHLNAQ